ncbi:ABC transporter permease OS=Streptomyces fumanus OX=67302 GN=GCM10018772_49010 PE=3 SV=1 [Streptomyces fumanus]
MGIEGGGTSAVVDGAPEPETKGEGKKLEGRSPGQLMWLRFKRDRTGVICAWVVLAYFVIAARPR